MTQPQIQTVKRTSAEVECEWKLSGVSEEWIPASDHDALEQRVSLQTAVIQDYQDNILPPLRESLREAQQLADVLIAEQRERAERAEASLREQEERAREFESVSAVWERHKDVLWAFIHEIADMKPAPARELFLAEIKKRVALSSNKSGGSTTV